MALIEGVSNEALFGFAVTVLLVLLSIFLDFFNGTRTRRENVISENQNVDRTSLASEHTTSNTDERINTKETFPTQDDDAHTNRDCPSGSCSESENVRRRVGSNNSTVQRSDQNQEETVVIKVKHNEDIRSFDVSRNVTVVELKRLAFPTEMNTGKRVRFVYAGQLLRNDNDPLISYGVKHNTVVHCVITDPPVAAQPPNTTVEHQEDLDLTRLLIPLLTAGLIMSWYGLITYKHIFTGSSIAILMFLTSLYFILVYALTVQ